MLERSQRFDPRQNMRTQYFEVFHYRDSHLEPVAVHHHDFYEIYFFLSGQVEYRVEGSTYRMQPGDLLLISPMELHQPIVNPASGPYERIVLWIDREYLEGLSSDDASLTRCFDRSLPGHKNLLQLSATQRTALTGRITELLRETYGSQYGGKLWATGAFLQLMVELNRIALESGGSGESAAQQKAPPPLVSQVLDYIGEHYREPLSLESLAEQFYVSKYHLSHEFQQAVGTSVYRYIILKRLLIAKQMLSGGVAPGAVCHHCGFGDYANFYRAFKAEYGISPRAYCEGGR